MMLEATNVNFPSGGVKAMPAIITHDAFGQDAYARQYAEIV